MSKNKNKLLHKNLYLLLWLLLFIFFGTPILMQLDRRIVLQQEREDYMLKLVEQDEIKSQLQKEIDFYESDFYVEKIAREKLGMVRPDEKVFYNDAKK